MYKLLLLFIDHTHIVQKYIIITKRKIYTINMRYITVI